MPILIQNSLTRKKEKFEPLNPPNVNMYTCGVTVYDRSHIGHARSLYIFDLIRRYLGYRGFKVRFVRNITDIDDKIINRANESGIDWRELTRTYIESYHQDLSALGLEKADIEPRATENIGDMVSYIQRLIDKGYAYQSGADVYFNVRKFAEYGKLSGQSIEQMQAGERIELSPLKKDRLDFVLWKGSKAHEPSWISPWGAGRPGWHIECSVMSQKFLGVPTLDIHAGGRDLIFPHHENEIAQAQALTGQPFAKYWMHQGLLTINGQKMSKSLGNFVTIRDFIACYRNPDILKMFFLSAHYSHPIDYSQDKIKEAQQAYKRVIILRDKIERGNSGGAALRLNILPPELKQIKQRFFEAMDDDFNTPRGLAVLFELVNLANKRICDKDILCCAGSLLESLFAVLGISFKRQAQDVLIDENQVELLIAERNEARRQSDFVRSDQIRKRLQDSGVILEDTKDGNTTWRRK